MSETERRITRRELLKRGVKALGLVIVGAGGIAAMKTGIEELDLSLKDEANAWADLKTDLQKAQEQSDERRVLAIAKSLAGLGVVIFAANKLKHAIFQNQY